VARAQIGTVIEPWRTEGGQPRASVTAILLLAALIVFGAGIIVD
jgi:hypothetical protein